MSFQPAAHIQRVLVVGAGTMGAGIAQLCAGFNIETTLCDVDEAVLARALERIRGSLERAKAKGKLGAIEPRAVLEKITTATDLERAAQNVDLAIEAVPERLELKQRIFCDLETHCPAHSVLATNTSSLPITEIASVCAQPERVIGMHFFNPAPRMPLIELVRGERTSPATLECARTFAQALNKEPIVVSDVPGFATSRLGLALGLEAMRMVEQGVASASDIDRAMRLGYGHPMGPLELTDLVGLDVRLGIAFALEKELGERFRPPQILRRMVRAGKLGRKSGEGFYRYDEKGRRLEGGNEPGR